MIRLAKRTLGVHTYTLAILVNTNDQLLLSMFEDAPKGRVCACVLRDECACIVSISVAQCNSQKIKQCFSIHGNWRIKMCVHFFNRIYHMYRHARTYVRAWWARKGCSRDLVDRSGILTKLGRPEIWNWRHKQRCVWQAKVEMDMLLAPQHQKIVFSSSCNDIWYVWRLTHIAS
jgi:hypothetical protein